MSTGASIQVKINTENTTRKTAPKLIVRIKPRNEDGKTVYDFDVFKDAIKHGALHSVTLSKKPSVETSATIGTIKRFTGLTIETKENRGTIRHEFTLSDLKFTEESFDQLIDALKSLYSATQSAPNQAAYTEALKTAKRQESYKQTLVIDDKEHSFTGEKIGSDAFSEIKKAFPKVKITQETLNERELLEYDQKAKKVVIKGTAYSANPTSSMSKLEEAKLIKTFEKLTAEGVKTRKRAREIIRDVAEELKPAKAKLDFERVVGYAPITILDFGNERSTDQVCKFLNSFKDAEELQAILNVYKENADIELEIEPYIAQERPNEFSGILAKMPIKQNGTIADGEQDYKIKLIQKSLATLAAINLSSREVIKEKRINECIQKAKEDALIEIRALEKTQTPIIQTETVSEESYTLSKIGPNSLEVMIKEIEEKNKKTSLRAFKEKTGVKVEIVSEGDLKRLKITFPEDAGADEIEMLRNKTEFALNSIYRKWQKERPEVPTANYHNDALNKSYVEKIIEATEAAYIKNPRVVYGGSSTIIEPINEHAKDETRADNIKTLQSPASLAPRFNGVNSLRNINLPEFEEHNGKVYLVFNKIEFDPKSFDPKKEDSDDVAWELTENQAKYVRALQNHDHKQILATGPAGCGKTALAVAFSLQQLRDGHIQRILFGGSARGLEETGYKQGSREEKNLAAAMPFLKYFYEFLGGQGNPKKGQEVFESLILSGKIEQVMFEDALGTSQDDAFIMYDEMQKIDWGMLTTVLSRIGKRSRMAVMGSETQNFIYQGQDSMYTRYIKTLREMLGGSGLNNKLHSVNELTKDDCKRSGLVRDLLEVFEEMEANGQHIMEKTPNHRRRHPTPPSPNGS